MRDVLLGLVVLLLCLIGIAQARMGLLGYLGFALMRPDILSYSLSAGRPYSKMLAVATLIGSIRHIPEVWRWFRNPFVIGLLLFHIPIALSVWFAVYPELAIRYYVPFMQMTAIVLLIPLMIRTATHFRWLLLTMALAHGAIGGKFGLWGILQGGIRFNTAYGGFISENNTFALAMTMVLPLCWHSRRVVQSALFKNMMLGLALLIIAAIVMSHSRAGALTLGLSFLMIALRSKYKLGVITLLLLLSLPAILLVKGSYMQRLSTIDDIEEDGSISSRIELQQAALRMWQDHPFLGVGFGGDNFAALASLYMGRGNKHVVHNNYLEILVGSGIFAFVLFTGLLWGAIRWLGRSVKKMRLEHPELEAYPAALEGALIAFAFGSLFASRAYYDFIYILLMSVAAWYEVTQQLTPNQASSAQPTQRIGTPAAASGQPVHSSRTVV